jgi:uncharacterized protein (UPF0332 family)
MEGDIKELSKYRLEKAKIDLDTALLNFENGKFAQSINRSYYAMFHATRALLALDEFDSKRHSGIISYFTRNYTNVGKIDRKYGEMLINAEKFRLKSDYDDFFLAGKETARSQLNNAKEFVEMVEKYLNN